MRYAVDSKRQELMATGIVNESYAWEEVDGKRRRSTTQERDENTGMLLWEVEVGYRKVDFGKQSTANVPVKVGAVDKPEPDDHSPITFTFLNVEVRINKNGNLVEYWTAEEIDQMTEAKTVANGKALKDDPTDTSAASSGSVSAPGEKSSSKSAA